MQDTVIILLAILITLVVITIILILYPKVLEFIKSKIITSNYNKVGPSSKLRLVNQLREAVTFLSKNLIGALITIENTENIDNLRTDGVILNANISSSLLIAIFSKESPLHDGAVVIRDNKIYYASTFYKITRKSMENSYGSRHRAAMGISEICDAITVVVSEENGNVKIFKSGSIHDVRLEEFQSQLEKHLI